MDAQLLGITGAFGLAAAAGLNTTLPLLLVGVLYRVGALGLAAPFDALGSDLAIVGLGLLALLEFASDKVPGLDTVAHALQWPLTMTAGAILFASQQSMITDVAPGLAVVIGVLTAGGIHALRAAARPAVTASTLGLGNSVASTTEDVAAGGLVLLVAWAPLLVPLALLALVAGGVFLAWRVAGVARRGTTWLRGARTTPR